LYDLISTLLDPRLVDTESILMHVGACSPMCIIIDMKQANVMYSFYMINMFIGYEPLILQIFITQRKFDSLFS